MSENGISGFLNGKIVFLWRGLLSSTIRCEPGLSWSSSSSNVSFTRLTSNWDVGLYKAVVYYSCSVLRKQRIYRLLSENNNKEIYLISVIVFNNHASMCLLFTNKGQEIVSCEKLSLRAKVDKSASPTEPDGSAESAQLCRFLSTTLSRSRT